MIIICEDATDQSLSLRGLSRLFYGGECDRAGAACQLFAYIVYHTISISFNSY